MPNNSFIVMGQAGPIDLLRGRVWERRSVDGPIPWPLSLNITHFVCRREGPLTVAPFHYGSIVSLTNVFFSTSQPRHVHLDLALSFPCVCINQAFLLWGALTFTCLLQLSAAAVVTQGVCVCTHWGELCAKCTWPLSLLFSLKSCSAAEQKGTSRGPPLRVGIAIYFYRRVEVAAMEAAAAHQLNVWFALTSI